MRRGAVIRWICWMFIPAGSLQAQFDIGGSLGAYHFTMEAREGEDHYGAGFDNEENDIAFSATAFYREKRSAHTDLGLELQYTVKEFDARYGYSGMSYGEHTDVHVTLHLLHFGIVPEVRMTYSGNTVLRFGAQFGWLLSGRMTGTGNTYDLLTGSTQSIYENTPTSDFKGDIRALFGMGFRIPVGTALGLTIDPYVSASIGSLLSAEPGSKSTEIGIKFGLAKHSTREALTSIIDRKTPDPPAQSW